VENLGVENYVLYKGKVEVEKIEKLKMKIRSQQKRKLKLLCDVLSSKSWKWKTALTGLERLKKIRHFDETFTQETLY
jgi:uncharacterized protein YajQ (UPF0234 family)